MEEQTSSATPPRLIPKQSLRPKRQHPSPDLTRNMPLGEATPAAAVGGPPCSKK